MENKQNESISPGLDYLTTIVAKQRIVIPANVLGSTGEDFDEMVTFIGAPLSQPVGNADTIMERLEPALLGKPTRTRLVAFANVSAAPVRIQAKGDDPVYFDIYVTLSPTMESPGETIFNSEDGISGTFESKVSLSPLFELRPLGGGGSIFIDTGMTPIPGFPMRLGSTGGKWSQIAPSQNAVRAFGGSTLYYPSEVLIESRNDAAVQVAACAKQQAQFFSPGHEMRYQRVGYPQPNAFTNLELNRWSGGNNR